MKHIKKRKEIKRILPKLEQDNRNMFNRMYSPEDLNAEVNTVVDQIPDHQVGWALVQVKNTYHAIFTSLAR
jgi:hypothetical protein